MLDKSKPLPPPSDQAVEEIPFHVPISDADLEKAYDAGRTEWATDERNEPNMMLPEARLAGLRYVYEEALIRQRDAMRPNPPTTPERSAGPWRTLGRAWRSDIFSAGDWNIYPPDGEAGPVAIASGEENARLIAAAPDLKAALEEAEKALAKIAFLRPAGSTTNKLAMKLERIAVDALDPIRAALARAGGK